jgi:uncharacterized repeat protein (TIGR03803 family)
MSNWQHDGGRAVKLGVAFAMATVGFLAYAAFIRPTPQPKVTAATVTAPDTTAPAIAGNYAVVYSFKGGDDGAEPVGVVSIGDTLYGTTDRGGRSSSCTDDKGCGTVFSVTTAGAEKVVYSFRAKAGRSNLISIGGAVYGTTSEGGNSYCPERNENVGCGIAYSMTPAGVETVLHLFTGAPDGARPKELLNIGGTLYGTTSEGGTGTACGASGCGTVFKITPKGIETVLYSFRGGDDGASPLAGLINEGGTFYGTTYIGGGIGCFDHGCGTVFRVTPEGTETVLHRFSGSPDGAAPFAGLINVGGTIFGTTVLGGDPKCGKLGCGTVFSITPKGVLTVLHSFKQSPDGAGPKGSLIDVDGMLYGVTMNGGTDTGCVAGCGMVFAMTGAGTETVLHSFKDRNGGNGPMSGLIYVGGMLYGTTVRGGANGYGTVFVLRPGAPVQDQPTTASAASASADEQASAPGNAPSEAYPEQATYIPGCDAEIYYPDILRFAASRPEMTYSGFRLVKVSSVLLVAPPGAGRCVATIKLMPLGSNDESRHQIVLLRYDIGILRGQQFIIGGIPGG